MAFNRPNSALRAFHGSAAGTIRRPSSLFWNARLYSGLLASVLFTFVFTQNTMANVSMGAFATCYESAGDNAIVTQKLTELGWQEVKDEQTIKELYKTLGVLLTLKAGIDFDSALFAASVKSQMKFKTKRNASSDYQWVGHFAFGDAAHAPLLTIAITKYGTGGYHQTCDLVARGYDLIPSASERAFLDVQETQFIPSIFDGYSAGPDIQARTGVSRDTLLFFYGQSTSSEANQ